MRIASKELMPRLTPLLRVAFALASLFALLPLVIVLGTYDLIPWLDVVGFPRSSGTVTVGLVAGLAFVALWGIALSGWNPLHRVDVAMAKMRAKAEAESQPAGLPPPLFERIVVVVVLGAVAFILHWLVFEGLPSGIVTLLK